MDNTLVFLRTAAGESASSQPTRVVQRHMRTALMLVDGQRQVADIVARFGDIGVGEAALADLLRSGLIETAEMRAHSSAAVAAPAKASPPRPGKHLPSQVTETDPRAASGIVETITLGDVDTDSGLPLRSRPMPPMPPRRPKNAIPQAEAPLPSALPAAEEEPPVRRKLRATRPSTPRTWASTVLALLLLVGLSIVAGLRYYPFERHVAQLEKGIATALGQPVKVGRFSLAFVPYPSMALDDVRIGEDGRVGVASIRFLPDPLSLLRERVAVRDLRVEGLDMAGSDLPLLARLLSGGDSGAGIDIHGLRFTDATLRFPDTVLSGLQGEAVAGVPGTLNFTTGDGALAGELFAADGGLRLRLASLNGWMPGFLGRLAFDRFEAEGRIETGALHLDKVYARIADGSVEGHAKVIFGAQTRIGAELQMKHVSLDKLLVLAKMDARAQGSASGLLRVGGPASKAADGSGLVVEGRVMVQNGSLQGFDLVEAVRSSNRGMVRGGTTRFEEFAGQVRVEGNAWQISRLRLQSGLLTAEGQISAGSDRKVAGLVNVELRGSAGSVRVPLTVTGSLGDPMLAASHGARAATAPEPS
jgi:hypothetical protein